MGDPRARTSAVAAGELRPPEPALDPLEFLSRSWSASGRAPTPTPPPPAALAASPIAEDAACELDDGGVVAAASGSSFSFASAATSQLIMERILAQSQEVAPLTSGRLSHSSGPLNGGGSLSDSPPVSPEIDDAKYCRAASTPKAQAYRAGNKTVGRWLKDRREKRKEETRAHNAQVHAAVSVAAVAAAVAAVAAATASASGGKDERAARTDMAVASAATLVAAQCVEAAEAMGAEREHLEAAVGSAVSVRTPGDIVTVTAAAATGVCPRRSPVLYRLDSGLHVQCDVIACCAVALRGAATLKARALKEVWNIAAVIPVEKGPGPVGGGGGGHHHQHHQKHGAPKQQLHRKMDSDGSSVSDLSLEEENSFLGICSQELLARGTELLKRTRKGALHWKVVSVYINRMGLVMLKTKSRHVAGTITKKKKSVVVEVCRDVPAWPGRHLLEDGGHRRYFGLRTAERRVVEFECGSQREYELWTKGVARLLSVAAERKRLA
ncbi:VAN3-binding protein [Zea mays]|uniref:VAN3-binding protein n=1 Tax=Zea mays TaxID=4577 RepID=A0A3L6EMX1_MAIZE|nr:hypothetical protein Zm00014a_024972 [Zea mays]PWZ22203.1 hypothetical protein Zm00014a_024972 [Zea mays]PWZ22204.1 hypothetical protein Zm00014a_024972 [Zea mays]PWZ22205.1 VAN3-binding protein [Zea mays]